MSDYKLISVKKTDKGNFKYEATFKNKKTERTKTTRFGYRPMKDYTQHKDKDRRKNYRSRHAKDLRTNDPTRAGYLSYYLLWGDSTSLRSNIASYKKKFGL